MKLLENIMLKKNILAFLSIRINHLMLCSYFFNYKTKD